MAAKKFASVVFLVLLFAATFGSAMAEGSRNSSMSEVRVNFNFRNYTDNNSDNVQTYTFLNYCRTTSPNYLTYPVKLEFWQVYSWKSDVRHGTQSHTAAAQYRNWGDSAAGTYHFTLRQYGGSHDVYNLLSCDVVNYGW